MNIMHYELYQCVSSNSLFEKKHFHMSHICDLFDHCDCELHYYLSSSFLLLKMSCNKCYIYDLFDQYELCEMCFFKSPTWVNAFSHDPHLLFFFIIFMNKINVWLQVSYLRKWFSAWVKFMLFLPITNWIFVLLQVWCCWKFHNDHISLY